MSDTDDSDVLAHAAAHHFNGSYFDNWDFAYSYPGEDVLYWSDDESHSEPYCKASSELMIPESSTFWEYTWPDIPFPEDGTVCLSPGFVELPNNCKSFRLAAQISPKEKGTTNSQLHIICYLNHEEKEMGLKIQGVTCMYEPGKIVELENSVIKPGFAVLSAQVWIQFPANHPRSLTFRFYVTGSVDSYSYQRSDIRLGGQLWAAAEAKHQTDVEFIVGDRSFWAHKFILAARSPVLKAMFGANMIESRTGRVRIDDADPETFDRFLHFLYTGQLDGEASPELGYIAEKYNVTTLTDICQSAADDEKESSADAAASSEATALPDIFQDFPMYSALPPSFWTNEDTR